MIGQVEEVRRRLREGNLPEALLAPSSGSVAGLGRAELRETAADFFASDGDVKFEVVNSWVHNGHGVLEWVWRGVDKGEFKTGKPFSIRGLSIIEVRDGKISRNRDYYDIATKMRDVGALPK